MGMSVCTACLREGWWHTVIRVAIGGPRALIILIYGTDPNRGETRVLDVVKVLPDGVPGSTTPAGSE